MLCEKLSVLQRQKFVKQSCKKALQKMFIIYMYIPTIHRGYKRQMHESYMQLGTQINMTKGSSVFSRVLIINCCACSDYRLFWFQVILELYKEGSLVMFMTFNGTASNIASWMSHSRLLSSSWTKLSPDTHFTYFSLTGYMPVKPVLHVHSNIY